MPLSIFDFPRMMLAGIPFFTIRRCVRASESAGVPLQPNQLELQHLSGGQIDDCTLAWISASEREIDMAWDTICAIDLADYDPVRTVHFLADRGLDPDEVLTRDSFPELVKFSKRDG